jgi:hypothetical protein
MGMYHGIYTVQMGYCGHCNKKYVTGGIFVEDDSGYHTWEQSFNCPNCNTHRPKKVHEANAKKEMKLAHRQLEDILLVNGPTDTQLRNV